MTYSFPTAAAAESYLTSHGWTHKGDYFAKPTLRGDNKAIPAVAIVKITHNTVDPVFGKSDYYTVDFV